jgi:transcriptional regulator with XRE-family HTH domain
MSNIRRIREALNMTQVQMAAAMGISQGMVSLYESGASSLPVAKAQELIKLANKRGHELTLDAIYAKPKPKRRKAVA